MQEATKPTQNRVMTWQIMAKNMLELSKFKAQKHATLQGYKYDYTTSTRSMQEVTKTAKNRVMEGLKSHKNEPKQSHKEVKIHAFLMSHQHMQIREGEGGPPPPIWDLKTTFPPLKFL